MAAINLDIGGNTRQLDRDIQKTVNKVYTINLKTKGDQPLGRITGQVNEFNKSLDASNARVIAFGASAGIIFGVERAFGALVQATIEVQKSLQDINVILNVSTEQLNKFGGELFSIARNTGQSFQEVANAATEFSRQGLGIEETLKRTNEALILSRLSGLDAAKSVESLTAAVNSFASQAVTATEVVNKFATVDAAFAVSSADLADAISRVGSSAAQSGVSLNELIAIVTSAQQTTARGGAVIGNSFKTIFTRLQREKVVDLLESLGISGTDASGQVKSTIQLLTDLGKVYDTLGSQQQAYVAEQVGGVFQINILKAALADLGKEYSIYNNALNVAAGATDQAIRRNEELNKTYAAQLNALAENARQLAAAGGERLLGPSIDRLVGGTNTLLEGFNEADGQSVGTILGKGILDGIGQFIAGPGLVLIGGVLLKLFRDLAKFATGSVQQLLGLNTAATQQRDLQVSIQQILSKNPQLLALALKGEQGLNQAANTLLASLQKQTVELQKQAQVAQQISKAFISQAGVRISGGVPTVPTGRTPRTRSNGFIPNFSIQSELKGIKKSPDYTSSQKRKAAGDIRTANIPGIGPTVYNGQESIVDSEKVAMAMGYPTGTKPKNPAEKYSILTPAMQDNLGFTAKGFIPNFAKEKIINENLYGYLVPSITPGGAPGTDGVIRPGTYQGQKFSGARAYAPNIRRVSKVSDPLEDSVAKSVYQAAAKYSQELKPLGRSVGTKEIEQGFQSIAGAKGAVQAAIGSAFEVAIVKSLDYQAAQREAGGNFDVRGGAGLSQVLKLFNIKGVRLADFKVSTSDDNIGSFRSKILKEIGAGAFEKTEIKSNARQQVINELRNDPKFKEAFRADGSLKTGYAIPPGFNEELEKRTGQKILKDYNPRLLTKRGRASGFIPNFAAIAEVMALENAMAPPGEKANFYEKPIPHVRYQSTFGQAMADHGGKNRALKDSMMAQKKAGIIKSSGFIPNFAEPAAPTENVATALGVQLASILPLLALSAQRGDEYAESLQRITQENQAAGKVTNELNRTQRNYILQQLKAGNITADIAKKQIADARKFGPSATQAVGARFGGGGGAAFAAATIAPILAETLKQGIDQSTKEGRIGGAVTSGLGQTAAFAATGFAVGGPVGAAVGAVVGAGLTLKSVLDELNTDFPELAAAAQQAQEKLTQFGDQSNRITQAVEQIKQVRESGNVQKAGELQAELLRTVSAEFADRPELGARIITSITNNDFESLTTALNENTAALVEDSKLKTEEAFRVKNIETLRDEGVGSKKGKEAITSLGKQLMFDVSKSGLDLTKGGIDTTGIDNLIKNLGSASQNQVIASQAALAAGPYGGGAVRQSIEAEFTTADLLKYIEESGLPETVRELVKNLIEKGGTVQEATALLEEYKKNIDNANNVAIQIANQTGIGNKALEAVNKALGRISENFNKLAILSDEAIALETVFKNERKQAVDAYNVSVLEESVQTAVSFGAKSQQKEFAAGAGLGKIQSDFDKSMGDSLQSVTTLIGQAFNKSFTQQFSAIGSFDSQNKNPDTRGRNQLAEAQRLAQNLIPDNIISMVEGIIKPENFGTEGFNVAEIVTALKENNDFQKLGADEQNATIQRVTEELKKSNQTLQSSKILLEQQKAILANQKLNEIMREFADAIQNAFGGVSKFLEGKYGDKTMTDNMFDILGERRSYREAAGRDGVMDRQTSTEMGRTAGQYTDLLEGMIGRKGVFGTNDKLVQEEITGYANNIEGIFNQAIKDAQASGDIAAIEGLDKTRIELIRQSGLDATPEDFTGSMRDVFEAISRMAVTQRRETGQIEEGLKAAAIEQLAKSGPMGEQLAELAKKGVGGISTESIFIDQGREQNRLLGEILAAIQQGQDESTKASLEAETSLDRNPFAGGPVDASLSTFMDQPLPSISLDDENISLDLGATQSLAPSSFLTPSLEDPSTLNPTTSLFPTVGTPIPPPETPLIPTVPAPALDLNAPTSLMPSTPLINVPEQGFTLGGAASETPLPLMANDLFAGANIQIPAEAITVAPSNTSSPADTTPSALGTQQVFSKASLDTLKDFFAGFSQMRSQYNSPTVPIPIAPKSVNTTPVSPNEGTTAPTSPTASVNVPVSVNVNATTAQTQMAQVNWEQLGPEIQSLVDSNMPALLSKIGAQTQRNEQVLNNILSNPQFASFRPAPSQTSSQGTMPA